MWNWNLICSDGPSPSDFPLWIEMLLPLDPAVLSDGGGAWCTYSSLLTFPPSSVVFFPCFSVSLEGHSANEHWDIPSGSFCPWHAGLDGSSLMQLEGAVFSHPQLYSNKEYSLAGTGRKALNLCRCLLEAALHPSSLFSLTSLPLSASPAPFSPLRSSSIFSLKGLEGISWHSPNSLGLSALLRQSPNKCLTPLPLGQSFSLSHLSQRYRPFSSLLRGFSSFHSHSTLPCRQKFRSLLGISPESLYWSQLYQSQLYHGVPLIPVQSLQLLHLEQQWCTGQCFSF